MDPNLYTDDGREAAEELIEGVLGEVSGEGSLACAIVHIANMRRIKTLFGQVAAREFIDKIEHRLIDLARSRKRVARCGHDHFLVLLPGILNEGHSKLVAQKLSLTLREPVGTDDRFIEPDYALGIALTDVGQQTIDSVLKRAELALIHALDSGQRHALYRESMQKELADTWQFEHALRDAIEQNNFSVHYQPQLDLNDRTVHGCEALVRWTHETLGSIPPDRFVAAAERLNLISPLTSLVVKQVFQAYGELRAMGFHRISINLSAKDLEDPELADNMVQLMAIWDVPAQALIFEVTESCFLSGDDTVATQLRKLREMGCALSIDDFGTGYSSLAHFRAIPATEIKIDRSFVRRMTADEADRHIVAVALDLARRFDLASVAEGVETEEEESLLREMGCHLAQGYRYAKPMPLEALRDWRREQND